MSTDSPQILIPTELVRIANEYQLGKRDLQTAQQLLHVARMYMVELEETR